MKKLFNIITLSLAFAPALHGDVQKHIEYMKELIAVADAQTFKEEFTFTSNYPEFFPELVQHALKARQQRQDELENMGDATTNKTTLAKGIAQTIGGGASVLNFLHFLDFLHTNDYLKWVLLPYYPTGDFLLQALEPLCSDNNMNDEIVKFTHAIAAAPLSYFLLKYGLQNIKNGWNYKEYLEQLIASLDEIIVYIQQAKRTLE